MNESSQHQPSVTSSHRAHEQNAEGLTVRFAVLTLSDTRSIETDTSGRTIAELLRAAGHVVAAQSLIRDEPEVLEATLHRWLADESIDAIITTGGTGVSKRDHTIPTIEANLQMPLPGFGELFRAISFQEIGPAAMLSRAVAGIARGKFLAALPGSTNAVTLAMSKLILPQIRHVIAELRK